MGIQQESFLSSTVCYADCLALGGELGTGADARVLTILVKGVVVVVQRWLNCVILSKEKVRVSDMGAEGKEELVFMAH